jgi:hypothetical protein
MTASAHDLALGDLDIEALKGDSVMGQFSDVRLLGSDMIELEHYRVGLATVRARMTTLARTRRQAALRRMRRIAAAH